MLLLTHSSFKGLQFVSDAFMNVKKHLYLTFNKIINIVYRCGNIIKYVIQKSLFNSKKYKMRGLTLKLTKKHGGTSFLKYV